ncbi:hypothetical protein AYJ56_10505 [Brucella anthropi]|nr:hypothetical protein AYJ56_10505 [Brucella anthropi]
MLSVRVQQEQVADSIWQDDFSLSITTARGMRLSGSYLNNIKSPDEKFSSTPSVFFAGRQSVRADSLTQKPAYETLLLRFAFLYASILAHMGWWRAVHCLFP